jgi:hypothetical protein
MKGRKMSRIHAICVVRDEADIISDALDAALTWARAVYVLDHSSTDGTWEILQSAARQEPRVVLLGRHTGPFSNALRPQMVARVSERAVLGDWWAWLDADEFLVDNPHDLLPRLPLRYGVVHSASIEYYFTDRDLEAYQANPETYIRTWTIDTPRYYTTGWGEERFFRHVPGAPWSAIEAQAPAPTRVRLRHLQYRTPTQIERRLVARLHHDEFSHESVDGWTPTGRSSDVIFRTPPTDAPLWQRRVVRAEALQFDVGDGNYEIDWAAMPRLSPDMSFRRRLLRGRTVSRLWLQRLQRAGRRSRAA